MYPYAFAAVWCLLVCAPHTRRFEIVKFIQFQKHQRKIRVLLVVFFVLVHHTEIHQRQLCHTVAMRAIAMVINDDFQIVLLQTHGH